MSTKTSIKRIALVAAAALTLGGFSVITASSANAAATWNVTSAISGTGANSTTATTSAGSIATVALYNTTLDTSYQVTTTGSSILTAVATTAGGTSSTLNLNATNVQGGVLWTVAGGDATGIDTLTVQVTSLVAGTTYINVTPYVSGVVGTAVQIPVTFVTAGSTAISATNSTVTVVKTATNCDSSVLVSTTPAQDAAKLAALSDVRKSLSYKDTTNGSAGFLCVIPRDGNGNAISISSYSVIAPIGFVTTAHSVTNTGATAHSTNKGYTWPIWGDGTSMGKTSFTAILTDGAANTISLSVPFTFFGAPVSVSLTQLQTAAPVGNSIATTTALSTSGYYDTSKYNWEMATVGGLDSLGNAVSFASTVSTGVTVAQTYGLAITVSTSTATAARGTSTAASSVALGYDAVNGSGSQAIAMTPSATTAEKISVTAYVTSSVDGITKIDSAPMTIYASSTSSTGATLTVTPSTTDGDSGSAITANVTATEKNGYPVPDNSAITVVAGQGGVAVGGGSVTDNGTFATPVTVILGTDNTTITALYGSVSATSSVVVSGGSGGTSALSLDAANAATDAANNAYDEAQNATQAASDALAAVTALSAQVGALIATVKSLAAVVAKIKAKVKA